MGGGLFKHTLMCKVITSARYQHIPTSGIERTKRWSPDAPRRFCAVGHCSGGAVKIYSAHIK